MKELAALFPSLKDAWESNSADYTELAKKAVVIIRKHAKDSADLTFIDHAFKDPGTVEPKTFGKFIRLQDLPVVIDAPGRYLLRGGLTATINEITGPSLFTAKGMILRLDKKGKEHPTYEVWHISGRCFPVEESGRDIIAKI